MKQLNKQNRFDIPWVAFKWSDVCAHYITSWPPRLFHRWEPRLQVVNKIPQTGRVWVRPVGSTPTLSPLYPTASHDYNSLPFKWVTHLSRKVVPLFEITIRITYICRILGISCLFYYFSSLLYPLREYLLQIYYILLIYLAFLLCKKMTCVSLVFCFFIFAFEDWYHLLFVP